MPSRHCDMPAREQSILVCDGEVGNATRGSLQERPLVAPRGRVVGRVLIRAAGGRVWEHATYRRKTRRLNLECDNARFLKCRAAWRALGRGSKSEWAPFHQVRAFCYSSNGTKCQEPCATAGRRSPYKATALPATAAELHVAPDEALATLGTSQVNVEPLGGHANP